MLWAFCVRTAIHLNVSVNNQTDLWHLLHNLQEICRLTKAEQNSNLFGIRRYFPSAWNQQLPTEESKSAFKIQLVPSHYILVSASSIYEFTNITSKQGKNKQKPHTSSTSRLFPPIKKLLIFSPPTNSLVPYKPSNSLILFHLKSMHLFHVTLWSSEHTPLLAFLPSSSQSLCILSWAFCCKSACLQKAKGILSGLKKVSWVYIPIGNI